MLSLRTVWPSLFMAKRITNGWRWARAEESFGEMLRQVPSYPGGCFAAACAARIWSNRSEVQKHRYARPREISVAAACW